MHAVPNIIRQIFPPFLAFICGTTLSLLSAYFAGADPFSPFSYSHWDSGHYLKISHEGYELFKCIENNPNSQWCGNAGWFPLYPFVLYIIGQLGLSHEFIGILVSHIFYASTLILLWKYYLSKQKPIPGLAALFTAAIFPGGIYYHAVFPLSTFVFFILLTIIFYQKNQFYKAGAAAFLSSLTYPPGVWITGVLLIGKKIWKLNKHTLIIFPVATIGAISGFLAVYTIQYIQVGVWGAYMLIGSKYVPSLTNPITTFFNQTANIMRLDFTNVSIVETQTFLCLIYLILLTLFYLHSLYKNKNSHHEWPIFIFLLVYEIFPMTLGLGLSQFRSHAMLLPSVALMHHLPLWLQFGFLFSFTTIYVHLSILFFQGSII